MVLALAVSLASACASHAAVLQVPEDYGSIVGALHAATYGDTILVAPGVYQEQGLMMKSGVCLRSETGDPESVTIDAWYVETVIECWDVDSNTRIEGLTLTRGEPYGEFWPDNCGGGVFCVNSSPTIADCVLSDNRGYLYGGGIYCSDSSPLITECVFRSNCALSGGGVAWHGGAPQIVDCVFEDNWASLYSGGALLVADSGSGTLVSDCFFEGNSAPVGGAIKCSTSPLRLARCTMVSNSSPQGSVLSCSGGTPFIESCTISDNSGSGAVDLTVSSHCEIRASIIVFTGGGAAVQCDDTSVATLECCDLFGNDLGDWVGPVAGQGELAGNFSADPLFCREQNADTPYSLSEGSPCAESQQPICGLVGASGVGCGQTAVRPLSWSYIKAHYGT